MADPSKLERLKLVHEYLGLLVADEEAKLALAQRHQRRQEIIVRVPQISNILGYLKPPSLEAPASPSPTPADIPTNSAGVSKKKKKKNVVPSLPGPLPNASTEEGGLTPDTERMSDQH